jgi:hypothetical protein
MMNTPLALVLTEEESDDELQRHQIAVALGALVFMRAEQSRREHTDCRQVRRRYFVRSDLLPNPRLSTPWQALYLSFHPVSQLFGTPHQSLVMILHCCPPYSSTISRCCWCIKPCSALAHTYFRTNPNYRFTLYYKTTED